MALTPLLQQLYQELNNPMFINSFLFSSILLLLLIALNFFKGNRKLNLPPSPPRLPVIGHMHLIGTLPSKSVRTLSQRYGHLFLVYLGRTPTLVVSSAEMAREILKVQDVTFSNRFQSQAGKIIMHGCRDLAFSPHGEYWRQMRKICVTQLFSLNRVHSFHSIREQEVLGLIEKIRSASFDSAPINLGELFLHLSCNIISRSTLGRKYDGQDKRLAEFSRSLMNHFGEFCFQDIFPSLGWMDVLSGFLMRLKNTSAGMDAVLDEIIKAHMSSKENYDQLDKNCFVEILLQLQKEGLMGMDITHESIKAILLDMFLGGTDTTSTTMEWAVTELMKNPSKMKKAQEEVRRVVGIKSGVDQDSIDQMDYLKCVVKETLRLHPLLLRRELIESTKLGGYDIPPKTRVWINAWTIQRDPNLWDRPEEFLPDRFVKNRVDFKGQDFHFIPFGAGRRACPGISFAVMEIEYVLANLLFWFDWKLPRGVKDLDMSETFGLAARKKVHLELVPVLHSPESLM